MPGPQPHDSVTTIKVAVSASLALTLMVIDFLWLMRDEAKYVWPKLRTSWTARIYVLTRYVGMASQIYNVYFTVRMHLGVQTTPLGCRLWFVYQAVVVQFLLIFVEGLLMHRIYSIFLRSQIILAALILFALAQIASMWVSAHLSFPSNNHTVTCMMVGGNPGNAIFSATTMTTNLLIFFMTFSRYFFLPVGWTKQNLGRVVLRDSALSLSAITVMMLFLTLCSLGVIRPTMSGNITYYWLVFILWTSIGRIIVNHEKIPRGEREQEDGDTGNGTAQLTSQIEMGESIEPLDAECRPYTLASKTLQISLPTHITEASQFSPPSDKPSSTGLSVELSKHRLSLPSVCACDDDATQTETGSTTGSCKHRRTYA